MPNSPRCLNLTPGWPLNLSVFIEMLYWVPCISKAHSIGSLSIFPRVQPCTCIWLMFFIYPTLRYKQHKTDYETLPQTRPVPVPCRASGCKCKSYHYVPKNGTQPIRCQCKHFADEHLEVVPYKCTKGCTCKAFRSSYTCGCGEPTYAHKVHVLKGWWEDGW